MNIAYQVITKVDCEPKGNEYTPLAYQRGLDIVINNDKDFKDIPTEDWLPFGKVKAQVFTLGEIVIIDKDTGREIDGPQRKADKWWVEYRTFDNIEKAIRCSIRIYNKKLKES